jgi:hydrogenase nickel incorporation protein HypA/HybF
MHDLTYANQIIDRLRKEVAEDRKAAKITVEVSLSPFSHVTPERLREVFKLLVEDEGYANAVLEITALEFCVHCKKCDQNWKSAKPTFKCPKCDSADFDLQKWDEFCIDSILVR